MKVKAYLYLPDYDTAFQNLNDNINAYDDIIQELLAIKIKLKSLNSYELYYDSYNVSKFIEAADGFIDQLYLGGIEKQLQTIVSNHSRNVNMPHRRSNVSVYANWSNDLNIASSPFVVSESAECLLIDTDSEKTICICLGNSLGTRKEDLHIIKDDTQNVDSPPLVITIPLADSDISFIQWITTLSHGKFSLRKNPDFLPLDKYWHKQKIYRHIASGNHWYFDFFHKDNKIHYEVFDETGNSCLGEADSDGNLLAGTQKENKKISHIL